MRNEKQSESGETQEIKTKNSNRGRLKQAGIKRKCSLFCVVHPAHVLR
jgi:hypothetical protein